MSDIQRGCFSFKLSAARRVFKKVTPESMMLAVLAGVTPAPAWEGCQVSVAASDAPGDSTVQIQTNGPGAEAAAEALAEALGKFGIEPTACQASQAPSAPLSTAHGDRWE